MTTCSQRSCCVAGSTARELNATVACGSPERRLDGGGSPPLIVHIPRGFDGGRSCRPQIGASLAHDSVFSVKQNWSGENPTRRKPPTPAPRKHGVRTLRDRVAEPPSRSICFWTLHMVRKAGVVVTPLRAARPPHWVRPVTLHFTAA